VGGRRLNVVPDLSSSDLRKLARKENDGKVVARLLAIASALDGFDVAQAAKPCHQARERRLSSMGRRSPRQTSPAFGCHTPILDQNVDCGAGEVKGARSPSYAISSPSQEFVWDALW
jgi:hypothetical protein